MSELSRWPPSLSSTSSFIRSLLRSFVHSFVPSFVVHRSVVPSFLRSLFDVCVHHFARSLLRCCLPSCQCVRSFHLSYELSPFTTLHTYFHLVGCFLPVVLSFFLSFCVRPLIACCLRACVFVFVSVCAYCCRHSSLSPSSFHSRRGRCRPRPRYPRPRPIIIAVVVVGVVVVVECVVVAIGHCCCRSR